MLKLLAIDTASAICSVGLLSSESLLTRTNDTPRQAAQQILPMIADLLEEARLELSRLDTIAVLAGPGSFTGIRIGIAVAQGLSVANSIPLLPLSSLAVKAMAAHRLSQRRYQLVAELARDDEVYFASYRSSTMLGVELLGTEQVTVPRELQLPTEIVSAMSQVQATGEAWEQRQDLESSLGIALNTPPINPPFEIRDLIGLAELRFAHGEAVAAELASPNYVKEHLHYRR